MNRQGYARLTAALVAAVGLHALLFSLLPTRQQIPLFTSAGALEVELLAAQHHAAVSPPAPRTTAIAIPSQPAAVTKPVTPTAKPVQMNKPVTPQSARQPIAIRTASTSNHLAAKPSRVHTTQHRPQPKPVTAVSKPVHAAQRAQPTPGSSDISAAAGSLGTPHVPQAVQQRMLTHVHYPGQARRHGWQGRAEFELNVQQQSIHAVTLLASTGFPILDRAAERGLASVSRIPLSNGLYRMPVVFHLQ